MPQNVREENKRKLQQVINLLQTCDLYLAQVWGNFPDLEQYKKYRIALENFGSLIQNVRSVIEDFEGHL